MPPWRLPAQPVRLWKADPSCVHAVLDKSLILKDNKSPAHFCLSDAGWELADKLARSSAGRVAVHEPPPVQSSPPRPAQPVASTSRTSLFRRESPLSSDDDLEVVEPAPRPAVAGIAATRPSSPVQSTPRGALTDSRPPTTASRSQVLHTSYEHFDTVSNSTADPSRPPLNRHPLVPVRDRLAPSSYKPPVFEPIIWPAGTYTICLVIDTREKGLRKSDQQEFVNAMRALDPTLEVEQRMLPVGDMLWIAKKMGGRVGMDEVVLDCIVERKRLDDLCSSITDGRYLSQKVSGRLVLSAGTRSLTQFRCRLG